MRVIQLLEEVMVHSSYPNNRVIEPVLDRETGRSLKSKDKDKKEGKDREKKRKDHPKLKHLPEALTVIHETALIRKTGVIIRVEDVVAAHLVSEGVAKYV